MEKNLELRNQIEQINNPDILKTTLFALLEKVHNLEQRLDTLGQNPENKNNISTTINNKREQLEKIRHGLTEMNERMERPYVVSSELKAVKEVLDILAENGDCNSIILEGEPGTGKTQWTYSEVGQELQEGKDVALVHVRVKDTMRAQDLLYTIDDVRRLSDAQAQVQVPEEIKNEAAIWKQKIVNGDTNPSTNKEYKAFKAKMEAITKLGEAAKDLDYLNYVDLGQLGEAIHLSGKGKKVFLLIDEIEKGREELMTGMLDEIENLTFTINETGTVIKGDKKNLRIVITTNTEDSDKIPPSFRRRSLYHYIDYPSQNDLAQIVELNFPGIQKKLLNYAISVFYQYHENSEVQKKPSTPELLSWVRVLIKECGDNIPDNIPHKEILLKYKDDQELDIWKINAKIEKQIEQKERALPHYIFRALKGDKVFQITDDLSSYDDSWKYGGFYTKLQNNGINFRLPIFDDEYNDEGKKELKQEFQIIVPGVDNLGDGYYAIPEDKIEIFEEILETKLEILPANSYSFDSVEEKNNLYTKGIIKTLNNDFEGFAVDDGRAVIYTQYQLKNG